MSQLKMLHIEVDGHHNGGKPHQPWVAQIGGPCSRYGLERDFLDAMRNYKGAHRACSGNLYGVVATFVLRDGIYEVCRARGRSSRRHVAREFLRVEDGQSQQIEPIEALALAEGHDDDVLVHAVPEADAQWVAHVTGLGTPPVLGWVVVDDKRRYRLRRGHLYEIVVGEKRRLVLVGDTIETITQPEALAWLAANQTR